MKIVFPLFVLDAGLDILSERAVVSIEKRMNEMLGVLWPDDDWRGLPVRHPCRDHDIRKIGDVVIMQVGQEDVVDIRRVYAHRNHLVGGSVSAVEQIMPVAHCNKYS